MVCQMQEVVAKRSVQCISHGEHFPLSQGVTQFIRCLCKYKDQMKVITEYKREISTGLRENEAGKGMKWEPSVGHSIPYIESQV